MIVIRYASADLPLPWNAGGGGCDGPPVILTFEKGETVVIGLAQAKGRWTLLESAPALPAAPAFGTTPHSPREFLVREVVHTLTRAVTAQRLQAARFLSRFAGDVPPEIPRALSAALGRDDDAWLETGCVFLGIFIPPPDDPAAFTYGETSQPFDQFRKMVTWILWKGDRRDYPNRLIRCLLRHAADFPWNAGMSLVQYRDSTVFIDGVNAAMRRNAAGSLTVAYVSVKAGQQAVLPAALELAGRIVEHAISSPAGELQPAVQLILNYGDAAQFDALVSTLARSKRENENFYRDLWSAAAYDANRRQLALAAVLIDDKRPGFHTLRYCDVAASTVQRFSGQDFGIKQEMSPAARDAAVARAAVWLAAHPRAR